MDTVFLSYSAGSEPIEDLAGNDAADLIAESVESWTPFLRESGLTELSLSGITLTDHLPSGLDTSVYESIPSDSETSHATVPFSTTQTTVTVETVLNQTPVTITPDDADGADGHQIALAVGHNIIIITVLIDDGVPDSTYAVLVTREPAPQSVPPIDPNDSRAPILTEARLIERVTLTYDELLDENSVPSAADFQLWIERDGSPHTSLGLGDVLVSGNSVSFDTEGQEPGDSIFLTYTPGANPIRDRAGNGVAGFARLSVINNTLLSDVAMLEELSLSGLDLSFDMWRDEYTVIAPDGLELTTVSASAILNGSIGITPSDADGAAEGHQVALTAGSSTVIRVTVTAEDGVSQHTYTANVVQWDDDQGDGNQRQSTSALPLPPKNLQFVAYADRVELTWDAVDSATSYRVLRRGQGDSEYAAIATTPNNGHTDSNVEVNKSYSYKVEAVSDSGNSDPSGSVSVVVLPLPPLAPTGLEATAGEDSVIVTWQAPDDDSITGYMVFRLLQGTDPPAEPQLIALVGPETTEYSDTGVEAGAAYEYRVVSLNLVGMSEPATVEVNPDHSEMKVASGPLSGFTLVDAADQWVLATLSDNARVGLSDPNGGSYAIRADVDSPESIGSMSLELTGAKTVAPRTENISPYSLYGDGGEKALHGEALPTGSYTLRAVAYTERDLGGDKLGTLEVSFTVSQSNRAPAFGIVSYDFSIGEDAAVGAAVGSVSATDADSDTLTYSITAGNEEGKFVMVGSTGVITLAGDLDHETDSSYTLTAQADDGDGGLATATVIIAVTDVEENSAPTFGSATYDFSIGEDAAVGAAVGIVSATDADGDSLTYTIRSGNGDGKFAMDGGSGAITVGGSLDHHTTASYALTSQADDGNGGTDTAIVNITVTDVTEDVPPPPDPPSNIQITATSESVTLTWDAPTQTPLAYLVYRKMRDADPPDEFLAYGHAEGDATGHTDTLVEADTAYTYYVVALNMSGESEPSEEVDVDTPPTNAAPAFGSASYSFSVAKDAVVGTAVGTVSAIDADGHTLTYTITSGNGDGKFAVDGGAGAITVAGALDYETDSSYALTVKADDGNGGTDTAAVDITVTDVDENSPPEFGSASYAFSIAEDAAVGDAVGSVSATDGDSDSLTYTITAGNEDGKFAINGSTGAVTVAGDLDQETTASYILTVKADDGNGGTTMATVDITVTDVEENSAPTFGSATYDFSIGEDADVGAHVDSVSATDADSDTLTYTITAGNGDSKFALNGSTGVITVAGSLDYETTASYTLTVQADDGNGGLATATVNISLTEVDENAPPEFGDTTYSFSVAEDADVGAAVGSVSATDADGDSLTYSITVGNEDGKFAVNGGTGAITVAAGLDYETTASYALTVQVSDGNGGTATAAVNIAVTDVVEDPDSTRDGAVSLGAQNPDQGRQFFRDLSLNRANGDAVDYYTFSTDARYTLGLGVRGQTINLDSWLEDASGNTVVQSGPPVDPDKDQSIEWLTTTIDAGTYYIKVQAMADGQTDYYLRFGLEEPGE